MNPNGEWEWSDSNTKGITQWADDEPSGYQDNEQCALFWARSDGYWNDANCRINKFERDDENDQNFYFLCDSPFWGSNTYKKFEMNVAENIAEPEIVSVHNIGNENICIDSMSINGDRIPSLTGNNWIGANEDSTYTHAVIKAPVCKTELINVRFDLDDIFTNVENNEKSFVKMECVNNNRLIPSTCSISQSYEITNTESFTISSEESLSTTNEVSWSQSETSSHEFYWENRYDATVSGSLPGDLGEASVSMGTTLANTFGTESTTEEGGLTSNSVTNTNGEETSFETSKTASVECAAEITVPASHSVPYLLKFQSNNVSVKMYADLKLTLCSQYLPNGNSSDSIKIIPDVPMYVKALQTTSCVVQFQAAEYIPNQMTCEEEANLAWSLLPSSPFIPKCQSQNASLYDGCQCDSGMATEHFRTQCYCSDEFGNMIDGKTAYVDGDELDGREEVCINELQCKNTEYGRKEKDNHKNKDKQKDKDDKNKDRDGKNKEKAAATSQIQNLDFIAFQKEIKDMKTTNHLLIAGLVMFNVIGCIFMCLFLKNKNKKKGFYMYDDVKVSDEDEEQQKLDV